MSVSRGQYGMSGKVTTEYFAVGAYRPDGGCYTTIVAAITRGIAYSTMAKQYPGCRIELTPMDKQRYYDEMDSFNFWQKNAGSARGPEPMI